MSGEGDSEWPVELRGVTETIVTTRGPNERWNVAALGIHAGEPATARTYGRTRTRRNFEERGAGYVQFTRDPVDFAEAALAVREEPDPILDSADAWVQVEVSRRGAETQGETEVVTWKLRPVETEVVDERVPTINRGFGAVVEATVAASRLDIEAYDRDVLRDRLAHCADVIETCGGDREQAALARIEELTDTDW